jgi:hypothetical protein
MSRRVRADKKLRAHRCKPRKRSGRRQNHAGASKSRSFLGYPRSLTQLLGKAIEKRAYTVRLIAIMCSFVLVVFVGLTMVALALRGVHVSHRLTWPVGLFGAASALVAGAIRLVKVFRHSGSRRSSDEGPHDTR